MQHKQIFILELSKIYYLTFYSHFKILYKSLIFMNQIIQTYNCLLIEFVIPNQSQIYFVEQKSLKRTFKLSF